MKYVLNVKRCLHHLYVVNTKSDRNSNTAFTYLFGTKMNFNESHLKLRFHLVLTRAITSAKKWAVSSARMGNSCMFSLFYELTLVSGKYEKYCHI